MCVSFIQGILGRCTQVESEIYERAMEHVRNMGEEKKRSSLKKRLMLRLRKDGYDASLCRSSWVATAKHPGGKVSQGKTMAACFLCDAASEYFILPCFFTIFVSASSPVSIRNWAGLP
jgi:hypothetical protein